jgi:signal transduction histidine kinase/ligand-binding sensor domain-containing protein
MHARRIQNFFLPNWLCGLAIVVICAANIYADKYHFDSRDTDSGLPQNSVKAILQTRDGYLWFTTLDGAVRYDGAKFTVFNTTNSPGIRSNRFASMKESADGALWLGTEDGGLTRYQNGEFHTFGADEGLPHNLVKTTAADENDELLVGTHNAVGRLKNDSFEILFKQPHPDRTYFGKSPSGLWFWDHTAYYRIKNDILETHPTGNALNSEYTSVIFEDRAGDLWIGRRDGGLYKLKGGDFQSPSQFFPLRQHFTSAFQDRQDQMWFGTASGALYVMQNERFVELIKPQESSTSDAIAGNGIISIYQDREGTIWCGTFARGLKQLNREIITVLTTNQGLGNVNVSAILEMNAGEIWIAANNVSRYKDGKFTNYTESKATFALAEDPEGALWLGGIDGLLRFKDEKFTDFEESITKLLGANFEIYDIHPDRAGNLWFGTNKGLIRLDGDGEAAKLFTTGDGLAGDNVKIIYEDANGNLWIGTYGGLSRFDGESFVNYTEQNGLSGNRVRSIYEDAGGTFWIGTYDRGLNRFRDGKFTGYTTADGLFNDGVFQILEDERGNLWMSSNRGIYRVAKSQLEDFAAGKINVVTSVAYGKQDGLLNTECNGGTQPAGIKTRDGRLWFPTQDGVAVIDPKDVSINPLPPPVVVESVLIDRQSAAFGDELKIAPGKNDLEINYTGLSFIKPEQVRFRYKLEGLNDDWIEAGNRRAAYYSYVPPGEYTFRVIAANSDGVWNTTGAMIRVVVQPPFWRTWWFAAALGFSLVGLGFLIYNRRVAVLKRAHHVQEAFSRRLMESQEQDRKRIAAELHDGLGQSLVIIKNRAVLSLTARENHERAFEQLNEIAGAATEALNEVKEITYNLRPYQLDRLGLTKAIESMLRRASSDATEFSFEIDSIDGRFPEDSEINVYRIVQESVNNIIKHASASLAKIRIKGCERTVEITIEDNGKGFNTGKIRSSGSGFGLLGIAERTRIFDGVFEVHSTVGRGTVISIELPTN